VQAFLRFSNFYRRFIKGFSRIVKPLVALTKKDARFEWNKKCSKAFETLKKAFITAPILRHFDPNKETIVEADSSSVLICPASPLPHLGQGKAEHQVRQGRGRQTTKFYRQGKARQG
jgi:hypothetical protein